MPADGSGTITPFRHVYRREIRSGEHTSLSALADRIKPGTRVLDLGTGSGALGKFLTYVKGCVVDGVNYNAVEAGLAEPYYRRVLVADLEQCDLNAMFAGERYDYIVCADVLEHIRSPERVARACHGLLAARGRLLLSVPNTGYAGLIAELIAGEFRYREEGLLDATHVRHFTRQTLLRFLQENGWAVQAVEPVTRDLTSSEFRVAFDNMPPAVARYLLAQPDAATYQFIMEARPASEAGAFEIDDSGFAPTAQALFSAQLFIRIGGRYAEDRKVMAAGVIGDERQTLVFPLPGQLDCQGAADGLRLDPADRAGYLQLHSMRLLASTARSSGTGIAGVTQLSRSMRCRASRWRCRRPALVALGARAAAGRRPVDRVAGARRAGRAWPRRLLRDRVLAGRCRPTTW